MNGQTIALEVWGDLACFTRPEAKVERMSYPVMTPSAARGILDAIYAKPKEFCWRVDKIEVLRPIRFIALKRNEVKEKIHMGEVTRAIAGGEGPCIVCDATKEMAGTDMAGRTQRQTIALKDVKYRIWAHIQPREGFKEQIKALEAQAKRRIEAGKCFCQPCMGCREFPAFFAPAAMEEASIAETRELGLMLYDVYDLNLFSFGDAKPYITLFKAELQNGALHIPPWESGGVMKP